MEVPEKVLDYLESFVRLDFIFRDANVSPDFVAVGRMVILCIVLLAGASLLYNILQKLLDFLTTLIRALFSSPVSTFIVLSFLMLAIPFRNDSLVSEWIPFLIIMAASMFTVITVGVVANFIVLQQKHGLDEALKFLTALPIPGMRGQDSTGMIGPMKADEAIKLIRALRAGDVQAPPVPQESSPLQAEEDGGCGLVRQPKRDL